MVEANHHQSRARSERIAGARWLLLIHQIPPKPDYFRVKIWRRLQSLGAVAIKNSVYALPNSDQTQEDFQWIVREITAGGGEAMVCEVRLIEGLSDDRVIELFQEARAREYTQLAEEADKQFQMLTVNGKTGRTDDGRAEIASQIARLKRRLAEVAALDFFEAPGAKETEERIAGLEAKLRSRLTARRDGRQREDQAVTSPSSEPGPQGIPNLGSPGQVPGTSSNRLQEYQGRTWVTRKGIHVDRIASAWLIRRFVDPQASFKFVPPQGYEPQAGEIRFDMFEAEFTHEGDCCTFEVLCDRFALEGGPLRAIAEIVHDIDLKESKFGRAETAGISRLIAGIAMNHKDDEDRLPRGFALFDDLYECFRSTPTDAVSAGRDWGPQAPAGKQLEPSEPPKSGEVSE